MPDPEKVASMPEPEVLTGNLKDPAKIAEKVAEAKRKQIDKAALDPHFARVLAIGTAVRDGDKIAADVDILQRGEVLDVAERRLLVSFWDRVRSRPDNRFATFYGSRFDIPFLYRRSLLLGVRPARIDCHPYRVAEADAEHLDVQQWLGQSECGDCHPHTLQWYAAAILGDACPYEVDKTKLADIWQAGDDETIKLLCGWDVFETLRLAELIHQYA
jgi:hypothetical protein